MGVSLLLVWLLMVTAAGVPASRARAAADTATCTEVIGFSQTRQWFLETPEFQGVVDGTKWQLRAANGGDVTFWNAGDRVEWSNPPESPCTTNSTQPDRVIYQLTTAFYANRSDTLLIRTFTANIIQSVRNKYPTAAIYLMPVIGGPNHELCDWPGGGGREGDPSYVRASWSFGVIAAAITAIVADDPAVGIALAPTIEIGSPGTFCDGYSDGVGHVKTSHLPALSFALGNAMLKRFGGVPSPSPSPTPSPTAPPSATPGTGSLLFSGSGYATSPNNSAYGTADFTLDLWFKDTNASANHGTTYLVSKGNSDLVAEEPFIAYAEWGVVCGGSRHLWTNYVVCRPAGATNTWHHLVVSSAGTSLTVTLDGGTTTATVAGRGSANTQSVFIGANGGAHSFWRGNVADVRINGIDALASATLVGATLSTETHP